MSTLRHFYFALLSNLVSVSSVAYSQRRAAKSKENARTTCRVGRILKSSAILVSLVVADTPNLPAQVPDGWIVTAVLRFCDPESLSFEVPAGRGGVFFINPEEPLSPIELVGVGDDLTGEMGCSGFARGANAVAIRPTDGALVVGEAGSTADLGIHVIRLNGIAVAEDIRYSIGNQGGGIDDLEVLADGDVVFVGGAGSDAIIGVLSPQADGENAVTRILGIPGLANAMVVDAAEEVVYVGMWESEVMSSIYRVRLSDLVAGSDVEPEDPLSPDFVATIPGGVTGLTSFHDDQLIASAFGTVGNKQGRSRFSERSLSSKISAWPG